MKILRTKNLERKQEKAITNIYMTKFHNSVTHLNGPQEPGNTLGSRNWFFFFFKSSTFYTNYFTPLNE